MVVSDYVLTAAVGAVALAVAATAWAVAARRREEARAASGDQRLEVLELEAGTATAALEAAGSALICLNGDDAILTAGADALARCAVIAGCPPLATRLVDALMQNDPAYAAVVQALIGQGEPCAFTARIGGASIGVLGGTAGGSAWLRLTPGGPASAIEGGDRRPLAVLEALGDIVWIISQEGELAWANAGWLAAVDASSLEDARERGLSFDKATEALARDARNAGGPRETLRWIAAGGQRRAYRIVAAPSVGDEIVLRATDVTETEDLREAVKRHATAHDDTLNHIADGVAVFTAAKRLAFHNTAFANLWGLEPAWLAEAPTHGELLDRLRQRRRLPETADYAAWKAHELGHYAELEQGPDELWSLPDGRTLRVVRQAHPMGGLLLLYSDITGELRLKAQYNALIQVHQATLDKLNDAIAVFASDGRLRLHNDAFEQFWNISKAQVEDAGDFNGVVDLCTPRLHDVGFWRDLKGRVTDPDPVSRVVTGGEARTSNDRIVAWQSRPLPDGATLIAFSDVTEKRGLEKAYQDRSAALAEAERLKRDFVGNVSYELRTPLTTIIGYSELLDFSGDALPAQARGYIGSVRLAATQLARSIDDVLDMAQIDAGEMALDLSDVTIAGMLDAAKDRFVRDCVELGVAIEIDCGSQIGLIRADPHRLGQALDHLLENALRQSPRGAIVTVTAGRAGSEITLRVNDRGRGIPFHVQAHIFDRFIGREQGGPGLALALVKANVELHGGWVALESEPGSGSTFTLHLPEEAIVDGPGQAEMF